jgi:sporulation protein YqfC
MLDTGRLEEECVPGQFVVELLGDHRVLIENHHRITQYDPDRISVQVGYGIVSISGGNLRLRHISSKKLVICGEIHGIELFRGGSS